MNRGPLRTVSPLDGRYARYTEPLVPYASEQALIGARVTVEVEYLLALAELDTVGLTLSEADREQLRTVVDTFDADDAALVKRIETEGHSDRPATNHDVKAVEYFLRERLPAGVDPAWVHFGLTSADINNLAYRLLLGPAVEEVLGPRLRAIRDRLDSLAERHRDLAMLARTHGQPATPTTLGKELAVYADRLHRQHDRVQSVQLRGKLAGASGSYAAHVAAYPDVDWPAFAQAFVEQLGLAHAPVTTQTNPGDDIARLCAALGGVNGVLLDLAVDAWLYISRDYLGQRTTAGEVGSSTMPHKVNPIDFENAEGNLSKATRELGFLSESLVRSRLQRDLSDSTVKRTIGATLAHCLIGYEKLADGLASVTPNEAAIAADLEAHPEVLGEAIQTILRREGDPEAYEAIRTATRDRNVSLTQLQSLIADLDVSEPVRAELQSLSPAAYTGVAADLADTRSPHGGDQEQNQSQRQNQDQD